MIIWNANPVAFSAWILEVRWYGIVYAIGFLIAYLVLRYAAKNKIIKNMTEHHVEDYILWLMLGSILGSRIVYILFYNPAYYFSNLLEMPAVWHGGLSIHGGLLGAVLVTYWFAKKHKISFFAIADILIMPLALLLVFGRMANYANAELVGKITNVPWCVKFPTADGCRHPSQIYEALYSLVLFSILLIMCETKKIREGTLFWTFIILYGAFRFIITFFREFDPTDPAFLGISIGQWLSLLMVVIGMIYIIKNFKQTTKQTTHKT